MRSFHPRTIFLAEDSPDDVEIARRGFRRSQLACELLVARDGVEALRLLAELRTEGRPPDLILLDINLPRCNGLEVLAAVRKDPWLGGVPVLMLSASAREEDVEQSYALGANTYIQKPVMFETFLETLDVLGKYWFEVARLPRQL